jgi:DGQHR domain-containing protein
MSKIEVLEIPAIAIRQGKNRELFAFAIDGKLLPSIAQISRLSRSANHDILGYQRPEVVSHISEIRSYLESEDAILPNAIVVAFNSRVSFTPASKKQTAKLDDSVQGFLKIPISADGAKPGWIVDGQQRTAAIREADISHFPVFVTAFITDNLDEQRAQFILVNATKPLPKGLIYELLPSTDMHLPSQLQRKRIPTRLLDILNSRAESPLYGRIQTPTNPTGIIKDNSILRMLEHSLNDGALYRRLLSAEDHDYESCVEFLFNFWRAVAATFPEEWNTPPKKSRLTHGAGIISMGHLMDAISDRFRNTPVISCEQFEADLAPLKLFCCWNSGHWEFGLGLQRKWNELQNTSKDIQLVSNYLLIQYKRLVWGKI